MAHAVSLTQQGLYQVQTHLNVKSHDEVPLAIEKVLAGTVTKLALTAIGVIEGLFFGMLSLSTLPLALIAPERFSVLRERTFGALKGGLDAFNSIFAPFAEVTQLSHLAEVTQLSPSLKVKDRVVTSLNTRFSKVMQFVNLNMDEKLAKAIEGLVIAGATFVASQSLFMISSLFVSEESMFLLASAISAGAIFAVSAESFLANSGAAILKGTGLGLLVGSIGSLSPSAGGALGALVGGISGRFLSSIGTAAGAGLGATLGSMGLSRGLILGTATGIVSAALLEEDEPKKKVNAASGHVNNIYYGRAFQPQQVTQPQAPQPHETPLSQAWNFSSPARSAVSDASVTVVGGVWNGTKSFAEWTFRKIFRIK